ncbi:MAG: hypothetical protein RML40_09575 [Bacteroidota bacterium]|nr:hypothetical protein [Candidatus Kapabacteria bacterium]MDW8220767.1 hypothetical protein [Bacteroidota bacterium]
MAKKTSSSSSKSAATQRSSTTKETGRDAQEKVQTPDAAAIHAIQQQSGITRRSAKKSDTSPASKSAVAQRDTKSSTEKNPASIKEAVDKSSKKATQSTKKTVSTTTPDSLVGAATAPASSPKPVAKSLKSRVQTQIVPSQRSSATSASNYDEMNNDSESTHEEQEFAPVPAALRQRPAVRYSDEDLEMFRKHIQAERKKALEEFQILREHLDDLTNSEMADENASYSMHMAEQGTDAQEKEKLYAHVQRISDYIKKLDEALQRIDNKVYGICKMCGILIAKERLLAVPITTQSASYKLRKRCPEDGIDRIIPLAQKQR